MFSEKEIINGCIKNDRKMQKELYRIYAPRMYSICLRYAKSREEAKDILQECFIKVFAKIDQFSGEHSFEGWMKRVFANTAITHYNTNLKYYYHDDITEINETETMHFNAAETEYSQEELLGVIESLSDGYRMVFNLFAIEGFKHKEIAEMLGIDETTSKSQFFRARKLIQKKLLELSGEKIINEEHE